MALIACSPERATVIEPHAARELRLPVDPVTVIAQAFPGARRSHEVNFMLQIEASLPGFGGAFIDSAGRVVASMKRTSTIPHAAVRQMLHAAYASRPPIVRDIMAGAQNAEIITAEYSLSELVAIQESVARSSTPIAGVVSLGLSLPLNRVTVGFENMAALTNGVAVIVSAGVPANALNAEATGRVVLAATWRDEHRPIRAGPRATVVNSGLGMVWWNPHKKQWEEWRTSSTMGYVVRAANNVEYLMVASHFINQWRGANGAQGDTLQQPDRLFCQQFVGCGGGPIGVVDNNPPWREVGCPQFPGITVDFCDESDVALVRFVPNITRNKEVGWSSTVGWVGADGSQQIGGWLAVEPPAPAELFWTVFKSGMVSGTTGGYVHSINAMVVSEILWGPNFETKRLLLQDLVQVRNARARPGDSGGPVFAWTSSGATALGIVSLTSEDENCTYDCFYYFVPWQKITERFGFELQPSSGTSGGGGSGGGGTGGGGSGGGGTQCPIDDPGCAEQ